jgi:pimeloyl-ACP methyl ester carboxylesterase
VTIAVAIVIVFELKKHGTTIFLTGVISIQNHKYIETNNIRLNVIHNGPENGPLVILLHGFPEFSYAWKQQIPFLVSNGYRVWAPDQRGYNISDKPKGVSSYATNELADDVIGLINAADRKQAFLVGHDWGAAIAWRVAAKYPNRIAKLTVINVPHGMVMKRYLKKNISQIQKSWYILFFQLPWLPEFLAKRQNWKMLKEFLTKSSHPGTFTAPDLAKYCQAWSQPNAFSSMLNWYRAMLQKPPQSHLNTRIRVPTLMIWGAQDIFLDRAMAQPSIDLCDNGRLIFIEKATHWVHHEAARQVNRLLHKFLQNK